MMRRLSIAGAVLALAVLAYLLWQSAADLPAIDLTDGMVWGSLALSVITYVGSQVFAAESWRGILHSTGLQPTAAQARSQFLLSQVGKYVPGNVAHLFGRVFLARADGLPGVAVGGALLIEAGLLLGTGLGFAGVLIALWPDSVAPILTAHPDLAAQLVPAAAVAVVVLGLGFGLAMLRRRLSRKGGQMPSPRALVWPVVLYLSSFALLGLSLWAATYPVAPDSPIDLLTCVVVFTVAWIAGFVIPGAPGGVGIRDGVIALGLAASLGLGPALAAALVHRMVSVAGDGATFGLGLLLRRRSAAMAPKSSQVRPISAADGS